MLTSHKKTKYSSAKKSGLKYTAYLTKKKGVNFPTYLGGGGISGDFPIKIILANIGGRDNLSSNAREVNARYTRILELVVLTTLPYLWSIVRSKLGESLLMITILL